MEENQAPPISAAQTLIDQANQAAERTEAANKRSEELLARLEAQAAIERLEGKSTAGIPSQPAVENPQDYAKRILRGEV